MPLSQAVHTLIGRIRLVAAIILAALVGLLLAFPALRSLSHPGYLGTLAIRPLLVFAFAYLLLSALLSLAGPLIIARLAVIGSSAGALGILAVALWRSRRCLDLLAVLLILLAAFGLGSALLSAFRQAQGLSRLERLSLAGGLGFGILSHLTLLLSQCGMLYWPLALAILAGIIVARRRSILRLCSELYYLGRSFFLNDCLTDLCFFSVACTFLVLCTIQALAPPVQYDDLNYHLLIPYHHARAHKFVPLPDVVQSYFYQGTEMLAALGFLLAGEATATLLNVAAGLLTAFGLAGLCRRLLSRQAGWLAAVFWISTPLVAWLMATGYSESGLALFCFLSFLAILSYLRDCTRGAAILAGALGAFAMSSKLNGAVFGAVALSVAVLWLLCRRRLRESLRLASWWAVGFVLLGWPWPLLRFLQTGNPVFPFLNAVFKAPGWDLRNVPFDLSAFGMGKGAAAFLSLPWNLTVHGERFVEAIHPNVIGPAPLLAVIFGLAAAGSLGLEGSCAVVIVLVFAVAWFLSAQFTRYLMPVLPLVVFISVQGFTRTMEAASPKLRLPLALCLCLLLIPPSLVIWMASYYNIPERLPTRVVFGAESRAEYLRRALPVSAAYDSIREACFSSSQRVFGIGNQFGYLCPSLVPWTSTRSAFIWAKQSDTDYREAMRQLGVTYVLVDESVGTLRGIPMVASGFLERAGVVVYSSPPFRVIKLDAVPLRPPPTRYQPVDKVAGSAPIKHLGHRMF
jgi:hypothetical protein